jgi:GAF domain-containing protein
VTKSPTVLDQDRSALGAIGRVLAAIGGAGFELQPVLDALAAEATSLCGADMGFVFLRDGDVLRFVAASGGRPEHWAHEREHPDPIDRRSINGRVALSGQAERIDDVPTDPEYGAAAYQIGGVRSLLGVPIRTDDALIGTFGLGREERNPFTDEEVALVTIFADQAAVAIRLGRLLTESHEAVERESAVAEVLRTIARSTFDLDRALQAVLDNAVRLARATGGNIAREEDGSFRLAAVTAGVPEELAEILEGRDFTNDRGSAMGRALMEHGPVQIPDALADPEYEVVDAQRVVGFRTILGIPLLNEGAAVGVLSVWRSEVDPFSEAEIRLVATFAEHAAVAIRLAGLLTETTEALERESAVGRVLQSLAGSTLDLDHLFQLVIERATFLSHADEGNLLRAEEGGRFRVAAFTPGVPEAFREALEGYIFEPGRGTLTGRVLMERGPVQIPDVQADSEYEFEAAPRTSGARTLLGVPLMRDGEPIGVLAVWRKDVKPFTNLEIGVVETFADQIGIAVRLVGLLDETSEALERESAVAQVLASIARSRFDLQAVLDSVTESAVRLSGADSGNMALIADGRYRIAASFGEKSAELRRMFEASRIELDRGSLVGRVTMEGGTVQINDVLADPEYAHLDMQQVVGFRTLLGVPLMREGEPMGVLIMQRSEVRPFTEPEIALITTFADQAALAVANVELYETVERQRAALAGFAPHVAGLLSSPEGEALLAGHRREISALFCDMRGFTAFAETAEPEELFSVLREYHAAVGEIAIGNGGMLEHFAGDGFMIFFNDPTPVPDHPMAALRTALAMQDRFAQLAAGWHRRGYDLGLGIGISLGFATLGRIGFEGRYDYAGVGAVTNLAARLSSAAAAGETLISQRLLSMVEDRVFGEPVEDLALKGFSHPVSAYRVTGLREVPPA